MAHRKTTLLAVAAAIIATFAARPAKQSQTSAAAPPAPPSASTGSNSIHFAYGGNVAEIPADFSGGLVLLPLHVNQSQPCFFVLDSTAAATSIDPQRAAELGLSTGQSAELEFAGVNLTLPSLPQTPKPDFGTRFGREYEGTLGRDFFENFVVAVDYARKTVRLYDPALYQYSGRGKGFHITFAGDMPVVSAKFNTNGKTIEADLGVNTALTVSVVLSERYARAHHMLSHLKTIPATEGSAGETQAAMLGRMRLFEIGSFPVEQAIATFSSSEQTTGSGKAQIVGQIGGRMLGRFNVIFDYPRQQIIFEPNSDRRVEEIEDMSGVSLVAHGPGLKTFEVTQVRPDTPGAEAGLQKGDIIEGIDEDPAADLSLVEVRDLFRQPGHPYRLTIERNDQTLHLTMKLHRLLPDSES
ncbi:MAG TPA: PDZ domain-containing protein [Candidatus Aquilonibacter sp.]|nr:PDZ domain-containing protein [Candidatus Aquilonibacter sp.]